MLAAKSFETDFVVLATSNFVFLSDLTNLHLSHSHKCSIRNEVAILDADNIAVFDNILHLQVIFAGVLVRGLETNLIVGRIGCIRQLDLAKLGPNIREEALARTVARSGGILFIMAFELNDRFTNQWGTRTTFRLDVFYNTLTVRAVQKAIVRSREIASKACITNAKEKVSEYGV